MSLSGIVCSRAKWFLLSIALPTLGLGLNKTAFSYNKKDEYSPDNWYRLDIAGNVCRGPRNSPIALESTPCDAYEGYGLYSGTCTLNDLDFQLTELGVKINYPKDGSCDINTLTVPGVSGNFRLLEVTIHGGSEHSIDGNFSGAEIQLVHEKINSQEGHLAVLAILVEPEGPKDNLFFGTLLDEWRAVRADSTASCAKAGYDVPTLYWLASGTPVNTRHSYVRSYFTSPRFNAYSLLPTNTSFYRYYGGLTTPPCSEIVWWSVADTVMRISTGQYAELVTMITTGYVNVTDEAGCEPWSVASPSGSTSRPLQARNGRPVDRICPV
jgi:carbonic anhydrase